MQAIILAAGMGKRLKALTKNNTKCMVKVNGVTLIERMLHQIEQHAFDRIVIVVGYEGEKLINYINTLGISTPITFIKNDVYDKTNNIYSLALAKKYLCEDDTILFESDLIFEDDILKMLIEDERDTLALVDKYESWMDGTCVKLDDNDSIISFVPGKEFDFSDSDAYYKTVNIYKFSKYFSQTHYVPFLQAYQDALGVNEYYEQVLRVIALLDDPIMKAKRLDGQLWYEIDDVQDLNIAESLFDTEEERIRKMQIRYGGYWRYPKVMDYCYLVNPYYPPKKLIDEIKNNFETLLTQYPSGMDINCLIASRNFNVSQENIVVGNGAAELIKELLNRFEGKLGVIRPTFEEYSHRFDADNIVVYWPKGEGYSYTARDVMDYFTVNPVDNLILINPDNPSGNYIVKSDMECLISWAKEKNIKLVIDESFVDFSDEENGTFLDLTILNKNPNLYVMKSISKSFGVPGLRLGILASGNTQEITYLRKKMAIWNINSFAEYYMQIFEKYRKDYIIAMDHFRKERKRFYQKLSSINGIKVVPSQANYFMIQLEGKVSSAELTRKLLSDYNILIKDLKGKLDSSDKEYIRIAIKTTSENDKLILAMKNILK